MPENEVMLICEELCRVIQRAERWQTISEAWLALLNVRRLYDEIEDEQNHLQHRSGIESSKTVETPD